MQNRVLTNVFPHLVPNQEALELNRLVCAPSVGFNGESWFCARAFRAAAEHGIRGLVAFSDPAKVTGGERGHHGVIARLVALGAPPPKPRQELTEWLRHAKATVGVRSQRHPGNR